MKSIGGKELGNVIRALQIAYHEKETAQVGDHWELGVMNLIRDKGANYIKYDFIEVFQRVVWKLVPVTCLLVILLGIIMTRIDFLTDYELAKIFINDPSDLSFLYLYNGSWG